MRIAALSDSTVPSGSTSVGIWPSGLSLSSSSNASLGSHDAVSIVLYGAPTTSSATWVVADPDPFLPYSVYIASPSLAPLRRFAARHHRRHALLHLLHRHILLVRGNGPDVAERIDKCPGAIAVELILDLLLHRGTGSDGLREARVDVRDIEQQAHRRAADRLRAAVTHLRHLVGEHHHAVADLDLGVTNRVVLTGEAHDFLGSECLLVIIERTRSTLDDEIGSYARVAGRNGLNHGIDSVAVTQAPQIPHFAPSLSRGRAGELGPDQPDRDALDREHGFPRIDDDGLKLRILRQQNDFAPAAPVALDRYLVVNPSHDDLSRPRLRHAVHCEEIAIEDACVFHARASYPQQIVRARREKLRIDPIVSLDVLDGKNGAPGRH